MRGQSGGKAGALLPGFVGEEGGFQRADKNARVRDGLGDNPGGAEFEGAVALFKRAHHQKRNVMKACLGL